jgi:PAS domain S-box-containing protein/putative nucleotidyltransferase with HDIG domain
LSGIILLLGRFMRPHTLYRSQIAIIIVGFLIPIIGTVLMLTGVSPAAQHDPTAFTTALGNLIIAWGLYRFRIFNIVPVGRDKVFEAMVDPVVILNNQNLIVDVNSAMLSLLGRNAAEVIGEPAKTVFADFPIPIKMYTDVSYARAEAAFELRGKAIYYEMTVWPLYNSSKKMTGRIYISHDITALKELEQKLRELNLDLEKRVRTRTRELAEAYDITLEGWAKALEFRDKETEGHSRRVTETTLKIARALDISEDELVQIRRGALLHDIGKMVIPDDILRKPGTLTDEELIIIRKHPEAAYQLLAPIPYLKKALEIPYCHHEKWDGTGYPRGLKRREIPVSARIFAVADVWDAVQSDRSYKKGWSQEEAVAHLKQQAGKYFDPRIVDLFLRLLEKGEI